MKALAVKGLLTGKIMTVPGVKKYRQISVPAAAVIQEVQALFIFIGRKGYVAGEKNFARKAGVITVAVCFKIISL